MSDFQADKDHAGRKIVCHSRRHTFGLYGAVQLRATPREILDLLGVSSFARVER